MNVTVALALLAGCLGGVAIVGWLYYLEERAALRRVLVIMQSWSEARERRATLGQHPPPSRNHPNHHGVN